MVSWRLTLIVLGSVLTGAAGGLLVVSHARFSIAVAAVVVAAVFVMLASNAVIGRLDVLKRATVSSRNHVIWLAWGAVAVHAAWLVALLAQPRHWLVLAFALFVFPVVEYGVTQLHGFLKTTAPSLKRSVLDLDYTPQDDTAQVFKAGLAKAGLGSLVVEGWEPVGGGVDDDD